MSTDSTSGELLLYASANYAAYSHRAGMTLRHLNSGWIQYFQPGDDEAAFRAELDALDNVPEPQRERLFDALASEYHA